VQQMSGRYKVKHPGLQPLYAQAQQLAHSIGRVTFEHVARAQNAHADRLANAAMDEAAGASVIHRPPRAKVSARDEHAPFSPLERRIRTFIYQRFVKTGRAPTEDDIVADSGASKLAVASALQKLAATHALVLAPATLNIWMAHPFSAVPTAYRVVTNGLTYFANCAWDAAGVLSIVGTDGDAHARCADCGAELAMRVRGGRMEGDGVIHFAVPPRRFWDNIAFT
jgi:Alkylmercury lyase/Reverse transcriptase-like